MRTPVAGDAVQALLEVEDHQHLGLLALEVREVGMAGVCTESFLLRRSQGKTLPSTTGAGVAHELPLHFLLSAKAEPAMRPADRRAVANFMLLRWLVERKKTMVYCW